MKELLEQTPWAKKGEPVQKRDVAVLLTTFNRPKFATDAIRSVVEQDCDRWRLYLLDDGSSEEVRGELLAATGQSLWRYRGEGVVMTADESIVWWKGPPRPMAARKSSIPYSRAINFCLRRLLISERYITYLCDDDYFYPESVRVRAEALDASPEHHVVYGRLRSVQYGDDGTFNRWAGHGAGSPGRYYPRPTGEREKVGGGFHHHFEDEALKDPETLLPYVEEGHWIEGASKYPDDGCTDHNQVMHRRDCLHDCRRWPPGAELGGGPQWWAEGVEHGVGDAAFFQLLGAIHPFVGINELVVTKRYHAQSDGMSSAEVRE
jgi:glycosyltransferase involved in cell wall biosynthesis